MIDLKAIRKEIGLTQLQLAREVGITQASYCNIECGRSQPSVQTAKRIADVLGLEWYMLFEGDDVIIPEQMYEKPDLERYRPRGAN